MGRIDNAFRTVQVTDGVTACAFRYYKLESRFRDKPSFVLAVERFDVQPSDWERLVYLATVQIADLEGLELTAAVFLLTNTHIDSPEFSPGTSWTDFVTPEVRSEKVIPTLIFREPPLAHQFFADLIGQPA